MKTGAQIVAELESGALERVQIVYHIHWPTIRAALLAYEPKSALRTILDRAEQAIREDHIYFSLDEITAARAELDALESRSGEP